MKNYQEFDKPKKPYHEIIMSELDNRIKNIIVSKKFRTFEYMDHTLSLCRQLYQTIIPTNAAKKMNPKLIKLARKIIAADELTNDIVKTPELHKLMQKITNFLSTANLESKDFSMEYLTNFLSHS